MTRTHFRIIAEVVSGQYLTPSQHAQLVRDLTTQFERISPLFDRAKFAADCTPTVPVATRVE